MAKTAFITGAKSVSGSAIVEYLCNKTSPDDWDSIIVTSRSPLSHTVTDPRIKFIALDFTHDIPSLVEKMKEVCGPVSHTYFCSYLHKEDFAESYAANKTMLESFLSALDKTAPSWRTLHSRLAESTTTSMLNPCRLRREKTTRAAMDHSKTSIFLKKTDWPKCSVARPGRGMPSGPRPSSVQTRSPMGSGHCHVLWICRELGTAAPMPRNQRYWDGTDDVSYAPLIADLTIFVSTRKSCANVAFNVSNGDYFSWRYMWPRLAASLGAKADSQQHFHKAVPREGELQLDWTLAERCQDKRKVWEDLCDRQGLPGAKATFDLAGWTVGDFLFPRTWSATLSVNKARRFGCTGHIDSYQSIVDTFDKFRHLGLIPK